MCFLDTRHSWGGEEWRSRQRLQGQQQTLPGNKELRKGTLHPVNSMGSGGTRGRARALRWGQSSSPKGKHCREGVAGAKGAWGEPIRASLRCRRTARYIWWTQPTNRWISDIVDCFDSSCGHMPLTDMQTGSDGIWRCCCNLSISGRKEDP